MSPWMESGRQYEGLGFPSFWLGGEFPPSTKDVVGQEGWWKRRGFQECLCLETSSLSGAVRLNILSGGVGGGGGGLG